MTFRARIHRTVPQNIGGQFGQPRTIFVTEKLSHRRGLSKTLVLIISQHATRFI